MTNWLQKRLKELKLTHDGFRQRLADEGIKRSRVTITNWVNETPIKLFNNPEDTRRLAAALNWSVDELLLAAGHNIDEKRLTVPAELKHYVRFYKKLSPYQREKFIESLDYVCSVISRIPPENPDEK